MNARDEYTLDKARVRASFDRAARGYDAAAVLQKEVRARMLERLDYVRVRPQHILDAGCGTGHAARALEKRYPGSHVFALDIALQMLKITNAADAWWQRFFSNRRSAICADIEHLPLQEKSMDLVWSNLALQWCNDPDRAFGEMARVLKTDGLLMFSTFGPDTLKELREVSAADAKHIHVSRFIDLHDLGDALVRAGFSAPVMDAEHFTLTYDDVLGVMRDLQAIGARNAAQGRPRGLEGKGFLASLTARYEQFRRDGKLPATFEVIYGHAWKGAAAENARADGAHVIKVHRR
ncbi:MAG: malonyl-ACP O-methyltransferase BioC [Methylobacillus sp.]|nr:malonyl-ACP O-methyltransferase BioC [Methylobacillus sp.]